MRKSNHELAKEVIEEVKLQMKNTLIYEVEISTKLPIGRFMDIIEIVKDTLSLIYNYNVAIAKMETCLCGKEAKA